VFHAEGEMEGRTLPSLDLIISKLGMSAQFASKLQVPGMYLRIVYTRSIGVRGLVSHFSLVCM
jgi:hypothetical protein